MQNAFCFRIKICKFRGMSFCGSFALSTTPAQAAEVSLAVAPARGLSRDAGHSRARKTTL